MREGIVTEEPRARFDDEGLKHVGHPATGLNVHCPAAWHCLVDSGGQHRKEGCKPLGCHLKDAVPALYVTVLKHRFA